eukprot:scaffold42836_cov27-Attheya_sp.AAC.1
MIPPSAAEAVDASLKERFTDDDFNLFPIVVEGEDAIPKERIMWMEDSCTKKRKNARRAFRRKRTKIRFQNLAMQQFPECNNLMNSSPVIGAVVFENEITKITNSPISFNFDEEETETDESTDVEPVVPNNVSKDVPPIQPTDETKEFKNGSSQLDGKVCSLVINNLKSEDFVGNSVRMLYTVEVDKSVLYELDNSSKDYSRDQLADGLREYALYSKGNPSYYYDDEMANNLLSDSDLAALFLEQEPRRERRSTRRDHEGTYRGKCHHYNECFGVTFPYMSDNIDPYNYVDEKQTCLRLNKSRVEGDKRSAMEMTQAFYSRFQRFDKWSNERTFLLGIYLFFEEPRNLSIGRRKQFVKVNYADVDIFEANIKRTHLIRRNSRQYYSAIQVEQLLHGTIGPLGLQQLIKSRTCNGGKPDVIHIPDHKDHVSKLFINVVTDDVKMPCGNS